jgi:hypothetical protein
MIKANDFRIGNYVYYKHPTTDLLIHKIEWLDFKEINEFPDIYNEYHKPIQLTEEILIKCGFKNKMNLMYINIFDGMLCISIKDFSYGLYSTEQRFNIGLSYSNSSKIEYLHQLQNLYFALTNEEITIQL